LVLVLGTCAVEPLPRRAMAALLRRPGARGAAATALAASAAVGTMAALGRLPEPLGSSGAGSAVAECEESRGVAAAVQSFRSAFLGRGGGSTAQQASASRPSEKELAAHGAVATTETRERWTLRSSARCAHAEFKGPHELSSRVRQDCGEDAFFLGKHLDGVVSLGIADGVGGWSSQGIDPALFAWELMNRCQDVAEETPSSSSSSPAPLACEEVAADPKRVLIGGFERLQRAAGGAPMGSSTACVASLDRHSGELRVANLGDSGALLVKGSSGACVMESVAQQHRFNCPYQLMVAPHGFGGGDAPTAADVYSARVEVGDVLVLATDGFLDNVSTEQAVALAAEMRAAEPGAIAERLLQLAQLHSKSWEETPFSISAKKHGHRHFGGKPDDITVLVAKVERVVE